MVFHGARFGDHFLTKAGRELIYHCTLLHKGKVLHQLIDECGTVPLLCDNNGHCINTTLEDEFEVVKKL